MKIYVADDEDKAWGGKRSKFYGADFVDDRKIGKTMIL